MENQNVQARGILPQFHRGIFSAIMNMLRSNFQDTVKSMPPAPIMLVNAQQAAVSCSTCRANCCKLEVILMGDDDVPDRFVHIDRWGGHVMARLDDGWCAALDRDTMLCSIYERRPNVCRDYALGGSDCLLERARI